MYIPAQGPGVPTHTAPRGSLYYRTADNTIYVQTGGPTGSTWSLITSGFVPETDLLRAKVSTDDANTTEAETSGMRLNVEGSSFYAFEAWLWLTDIGEEGTPLINFNGGTATLLSLCYVVEQVTESGTAGKNVLADEVTSIAANTSITARGKVYVKGFIWVDEPGTFAMRHADLTVKAGSWMHLTKG